MSNANRLQASHTLTQRGIETLGLNSNPSTEKKKNKTADERSEVLGCLGSVGNAARERKFVLFCFSHSCAFLNLAGNVEEIRGFMLCVPATPRH